MGSISAQQVAIKVSETIRQKKHVNLGEIVADTGYSPSVAKHPDRVTKTKSYQVALDMERLPLLEGLQKEINEIKSAMSKKNKNKEEYRTLAGSLDILIRNYQLLSGGATQRQVFVLPSEVMSKNTIHTIDSANNSIHDDSTQPTP